MSQSDWLAQVCHLPKSWALVAVDKDKRPYNPDHPQGREWQKYPLPRERFKTLNGRFGAVGLLLGPASGGLVAIDHDGDSATAKIEELSGLPILEALPMTVGFTSGRLGRYQVVYQVPEQYWGEIRTRKITTGIEKEQVEFRWEGTQSVIMGHHPETDGYSWIPERAPWEIVVTECPAWVIEQMLDDTPTHVNAPRQEWRIERPLEQPIPLVKLLTKKHAILIENGALHGERNDTGAALARDLIGCENWAHGGGISVEGSAQNLFWQFADRSGLSSRESKAIWRSAEKDNPEPARSDAGLKATVRWWEKQHKPKVTGTVVRPGIELSKSGLENEFTNTKHPVLRHRIYYEPGKLKEIKEEIIDYLACEVNPLEQIYVQGGDEQWLARVLTTGKKVGCCERLSLEKLTAVLDDKFQFYVDTKDGEKVVNCPAGVAKHFYHSSRWEGLPYLKGIINLPVLRMDGSVTIRPGYDKESGYLLDFTPEKFNLILEPTLDDAVNALAELRDLIDECAFADPKSRSAALSMFLTAVSRSAYSFAPLFAITANTPGAGKGALTEVATLLATGKRYSGMTTFHPEEVEFKKSLIATLQSGSSVVCFDNVDRRHEFGGANLETALTSTEFTGRMLGANANGSFSTQLLFLANGNRMRLTLDMSRRTILMTLDAKEENILEKTYSRDMVSHVEANRGRYVSAALTILQAYLREKPTVDIKPLNGYLEWSKLIRNSLIWLGEADPVPTSGDIFSLDGIEEKRHDLYALMDAWQEAFQVDPSPKTAKQIVSAAQGIPKLSSALEDVAKDFKAGGKVTPTALGYYLRGNCGTRVGNMRIVKAPCNNNEGVKWILETL